MSVHYTTPLPPMTYYKKKYNYSPKSIKNSIEYGSTNISLPVYPSLTNNQIDAICKTLKKLVEMIKKFYWLVDVVLSVTI